MAVHIGATWRICENRPCAAAMRPFCKITLTTCYNFVAATFAKKEEIAATQTHRSCITLLQNVAVYHLVCMRAGGLEKLVNMQQSV